MTGCSYSVLCIDFDNDLLPTFMKGFTNRSICQILNLCAKYCLLVCTKLCYLDVDSGSGMAPIISNTVKLWYNSSIILCLSLIFILELVKASFLGGMFFCRSVTFSLHCLQAVKKSLCVISVAVPASLSSQPDRIFPALLTA